VFAQAVLPARINQVKARRAVTCVVPAQLFLALAQSHHRVARVALLGRIPLLPLLFALPAHQVITVQ